MITYNYYKKHKNNILPALECLIYHSKKKTMCHQDCYCINECDKIIVNFDTKALKLYGQNFIVELRKVDKRNNIKDIFVRNKM